MIESLPARLPENTFVPAYSGLMTSLQNGGTDAPSSFIRFLLVRITALLVPSLVVACLALGLGIAFSDQSSRSDAARAVSSTKASGETPDSGITAVELEAVYEPVVGAKNSSAMLVLGMTKATDGAKELSDGIQQARQGSVELANGQSELRKGTARLGDGARQVSGGVTQLVDGVTGVAAYQGQIMEMIDRVLPTLVGDNDDVKQARESLKSLRRALGTSGIQEDLLEQLGKLNSGAKELSRQLNDPRAEYRNGVDRLAEGSIALRDGISQIDDGAKRLAQGQKQLLGLSRGVQKSVDGASDKLGEMLGNSYSEEVDEEGISTAASTRGANSAALPAVAPYLLMILVLLSTAIVGITGQSRNALARIARRVQATVDGSVIERLKAILYVGRGELWSWATTVVVAVIAATAVLSEGASMMMVVGIALILAIFTLMSFLLVRALLVLFGSTWGRIVVVTLTVVQAIVVGYVWFLPHPSKLSTFVEMLSPVSWGTQALSLVGTDYAQSDLWILGMGVGLSIIAAIGVLFWHRANSGDSEEAFIEHEHISNGG